MGKSKRKRDKRKPRTRRERRPGTPLSPGHVILADEESGTARHGIQFACPDCGLPAVLTHDDDDQPAALHDEPRCEAFEALASSEYVAWMRRAHGLDPQGSAGDTDTKGTPE